MTVKSEVARSEIDIKKLEGRIRRDTRSISAELHVTTSKIRERNIRAVVKLGEGWCVDNNSSSVTDIFIIPGNKAVGS